MLTIRELFCVIGYFTHIICITWYLNFLRPMNFRIKLETKFPQYHKWYSTLTHSTRLCLSQFKLKEWQGLPLIVLHSVQEVILRVTYIYVLTSVCTYCRAICPIPITGAYVAEQLMTYISSNYFAQIIIVQPNYRAYGPFIFLSAPVIVAEIVSLM